MGGLYTIDSANDLSHLNHKDVVDFTAYITSLDFVTSAKGTSYIQGTLEMKGKIPFKIWNGSLYERLRREDVCGGIYDFTGGATC